MPLLRNSIIPHGQRFWLATWVLVCLLGPAAARADAKDEADEVESFRCMTWNIWHGGREDGPEDGVRRVIETIQSSGADVVALQETYGSGEKIAEALGFHFHPRGTNVSLLSRFRIVEDISVFEPFKCVGAIIELPSSRRIAVFSIWLPFDGDIWRPGTREGKSRQELLQVCQPSYVDLTELWRQIQQRLSDTRYAGIPIIIAGDFNSMSGLDYVQYAVDQYGVAVDWPTSRVLREAGFHDAWRECFPEVDRLRDRTWSPRFPDQEQDRIDFIYYRGPGMHAIQTERIDHHPEKFPSDHAAVVAQFAVLAATPKGLPLRAVSYNIRHGLGSDGAFDLERTAAVLGNLRADVIGLQEVDLATTRSKGIDEPEWLAERLGMQSAFGRFMDFQGGQYGLATLSRFPILERRVVELPTGNEPRVALAIRIDPDGHGRALWVVNLHLDWVADDGFRFAQAEQLHRFLQQLTQPYVLLGDFNDRRGSRTVELLSRGAIEARKPSGASNTYPATDPTIEIDFIFAHPASSWRVGFSRVRAARRTSDHRPVSALLIHRPEPMSAP